MKIVCSSSMPYVRQAFETLGTVVVRDGRAITAEDVRDARVLAIRSTTGVNRSLIEGSAVEFVGTATIGTDHMDTDYLESKGIHWCSSPGCNANSVAEYVTAALLSLANRHSFTLEGQTLGVIGVGNVGSMVVKKAGALGMRVLQNDPPRQRAESKPVGTDPVGLAGTGLAGTDPDSMGTDFVSLEEVLAGSDVVTLHVPLTYEGRDATFHMADDTFFSRMRPGSVFLNSARGAVVDTDSLGRAIDGGVVAHAVIDTWEGEPVYRQDLLERVDMATPHIAGYSFDGKVMGTVMVYGEACRFLGVEPSWRPDDLLPAPEVPELIIDARDRREEAVLWDIVRQVYDITADDRRLRESCADDERVRGVNFDMLRQGYRTRREFRFTRAVVKNASPRLAGRISGLGFRA